MRLDFVGVDPGNPNDDCPAVFVDPTTGDFFFQGDTVTDPDVFSGDGEVTGHQFTDDPAVATLCATAFEAVWNLATDHEEYSPITS